MLMNMKTYLKKFKPNIVFFCPSMEEGGVEKNLILTSNFFSKKYNVKIISANRNKIKLFKRKIKFISLNYFSSYPRILKSIICFFLGFIALKKNDILISFESNIFAIVLSKFKNAKVIVRSNAHPSGYLKNNLKKSLFQFLFNLADAVVVNSYDFKKDIDSTLNINSIVIYNSLVKIKKPRKKFLSSKNKYKLISVGRLVPQKDHLTTLKAMRIIKDKINFRLIIIGKGKMLNNLKRYCQDNSLEKEVSFIGYKRNVNKYIENSDCMILSSIFEGQPNVIIESIGLGTLVISSNCKTGPREILQNGKAGYLFKPKNFTQLAKKIIHSYKNINQSLIKIENANKTLDKYNLKLNSQKYENIIFNLIKKTE